MIALMNAAMAEVITALIIWAVIERFGRVAKTKGKLRSFGLFMTLWVMAVAVHLFVLKPSDHTVAAASEPTTVGAVSEADTTTVAANKPELQAIARQVATGATVDRQVHDHFWSLIPKTLWSTPERRQETLAGLDEGVRFQKTLWDSLLLSAQAHQVVKTEAYEEALRQADPSARTKSEAMLRAAAAGPLMSFHPAKER